MIHVLNPSDQTVINENYTKKNCKSLIIIFFYRTEQQCTVNFIFYMIENEIIELLCF